MTADNDNLPGMTLENVDPTTARIFLALRNTAHLHHQFFMKKLAQEGGHPAMVLCLRVLSHHDGISQRDLAERLKLSRPWITKMVQALEKGGLVSRRADEQDQRVTRVFLTEQGRVREAELRAVWADYLNETIGSLSEDDRLQLERLIGLLSARVSEMLDQFGGTAGGATA
ncbi:MAG: MarR family transcriptional regulator [Actinobacteria bacterium]|nr:MarR family transcriptional regulator [Actinomycetota bacterium]